MHRNWVSTLIMLGRRYFDKELNSKSKWNQLYFAEFQIAFKMHLPTSWMCIWLRWQAGKSLSDIFYIIPISVAERHHHRRYIEYWWIYKKNASSYGSDATHWNCLLSHNTHNIICTAGMGRIRIYIPRHCLIETLSISTFYWPSFMSLVISFCNVVHHISK